VSFRPYRSILEKSPLVVSGFVPLRIAETAARMKQLFGTDRLGSDVPYLWSPMGHIIVRGLVRICLVPRDRTTLVFSPEPFLPLSYDRLKVGGTVRF
jgi:hypothetical protein